MEVILMTKTIMKILSLLLVSVMLVSMLASCAGEPGIQGEQGPQGVQGEKGDKGDAGDMGEQGPQGIEGLPGEKGEKGDDGEDGANGADGIVPHIGINGNWWIGETDTRVKAGGAEGAVPYIKNGYWYVDGTNTKIEAVGEKGEKGDAGKTSFAVSNEAQLLAAAAIGNVVIHLTQDIIITSAFVLPNNGTEIVYHGFDFVQVPEGAKIVTSTADLETAINDSEDGTTIYIAPGTYELVTVTKAELKGLTLIGSNGAVVKGIFFDTANVQLVEGLSLQNITFENKGVYFNCTNTAPFVTVDGLLMVDCSFVGAGKTSDVLGNRLFDVGADSTGSHTFTDITIKHCTVSNAIQGIRLNSLYGDNTIQGNTISDVGHNAITLRSCQGGTVLVSKNIISNGGDRAFRASSIAEGVTVTFENNFITNTGDADDGSNWKVNTNNGTVKFEGNTVNGSAWEG